ncbi:NAD-dependent epimerase/dehydratase family protein [Streptomyces chiangmaiensis]
MTVVIIGGSGSLGAESVRQATAAGHPTAAAYTTKPANASEAAWHPLDLPDSKRVDAVLAEAGPHRVVNASSGRAEWTITAQGPVRPAMAAAKAAAKTGVLLVHPQAVVARTSLIIGDGRCEHERIVHELAAGNRDRVLFTDGIRCPVHVADPAAALLELAPRDTTGIHRLAGPHAYGAVRD